MAGDLGFFSGVGGYRTRDLRSDSNLPGSGTFYTPPTSPARTSLTSSLSPWLGLRGAVRTVGSWSWGFVNGQGTTGFHGDVVERILVIRAGIDIDSRGDGTFEQSEPMLQQ